MPRHPNTAYYKHKIKVTKIVNSLNQISSKWYRLLSIDRRHGAIQSMNKTKYLLECFEPLEIFQTMHVATRSSEMVTAS